MKKLLLAVAIISFIFILLVGCTKEESSNEPLPAPQSERAEQIAPSNSPPPESDSSEEVVKDQEDQQQATPPSPTPLIAPKQSVPEPARKEFTITAKKWSFQPSEIRVNKGDQVHLTINSIDVTHGFSLGQYGISEILRSGKTVEVDFVADKAGDFTFFCSVECGQGHGSMKGTLIVE